MELILLFHVLIETSRLEGNNYTGIYGMFSLMRPSGCNFLIAHYEIKNHAESITIPSKVSFVLVLIEASPIVELTSEWHFSRLDFTWIYSAWFINE